MKKLLLTALALIPAMTFAANADWVESIEYLSNGKELEVTFAVNDGEERSANINVVFVDAWGDEHTAECVLTQKGLE